MHPVEGMYRLGHTMPFYVVPPFSGNPSPMVRGFLMSGPCGPARTLAILAPSLADKLTVRPHVGRQHVQGWYIMVLLH